MSNKKKNLETVKKHVAAKQKRKETVQEYLERNSVLDACDAMDGQFVPISIAFLAAEGIVTGRLKPSHPKGWKPEDDKEWFIPKNGMKPKKTFFDDGQYCMELYSRVFKGQFEYALVSRGDDGELINVILLKNGTATQKWYNGWEEDSYL